MIGPNYSVATTLVTLLLSGAAAGAILNLVRARTESKRAPVDRGQVIVTSAESAVAILQKVLDTTNSELTKKEGELAAITAKMEIIKTEFTALKQRCAELERMLEQAMANRNA